jgi:hypothetical protein
VKEIAGEDAQLGWQDAVDEFSEVKSQLTDRLAQEDLGRLLDLRPFLPVTIELGEYLVTQVIELVVHSDDLAVERRYPMARDTCSMVERPIGTVMFLFTDIGGSTHMWDEHWTEMTMVFGPSRWDRSFGDQAGGAAEAWAAA